MIIPTFMKLLFTKTTVEIKIERIFSVKGIFEEQYWRRDNYYDATNNNDKRKNETNEIKEEEFNTS